MTVEDIILDRDGRGISALRPHLPPDFCDQAAGLVLDHPGTAIVITGFYILAAGATETDGPPGAIVIGDALQYLGYEVVYVTDRLTEPLMSAIVGDRARVVDFPITDEDASRKFADELRSELDPSVIIAIERCGLTEAGVYLNWKGKNISEYNAKIDYLLTDHPHTVGIGDGGNEIGMGNLASVIATVPSLANDPCITTCTNLVISSVSNWGGYGLVASMSKLARKNLLPSIEAEQELVKRNVALGAVDGITTKSVNKVDGFTLEENSQTLEHLHALLAADGIAAA